MTDWQPIETAPKDGAEEWRPAIGWEGFYEVSSIGRLRSVTRTIIRRGGTKQTFHGRVMDLFPNDKGYLVARLSDSSAGRRVVARVHRLVASAFLSNEYDLPEVNHKDGDKKNNSIANLEWCSTKHNAIHAVAIGLNKIPKIPPSSVHAILAAHKRGISCGALARQFNVDRSSMRALLKGKTYSWAAPAPTGDREMSGDRPCTCHPDDKPPVPCERQYALTDCRTSRLARIAGLREAAEMLANRVGREAIFENKHKANGKHYKAREAAHVQRILNEERNNILARIAELEKP